MNKPPFGEFSMSLDYPPCQSLTRKRLLILVACEESQSVAMAFRALGHEAYSCDLEECSGGHPEYHIKGDAIKALYSRKWDLVIAHPPCTFLANSGVRWLVSRKERSGFEWHDGIKLYIDYKRYEAVLQGAAFFNKFVLYGKLGNAIVIENPIQHKYAKELINATHTQIIQPWQFGHLQTKATCLWLFNVDKLMETKNVYAEMMALPYAQRSEIHYASPGPERAKLRSKTYTGIADAMADQWGK